MDDRITITICGDGGCGKSSITLRIVRGQWTHEYDPTIEDSYTVTRAVDGTTYKISITDTAGQEEYRSMWSASNMHSDAFLLVYDITSTSSLQDLESFAGLINVECQNRQEQGRCWPALMAVGNKCDLQDMRQVIARDGLEWAKQRGYGFMETSARDMVNIEETVFALVRRVVEARRMFASGQRPVAPLAPKMAGWDYEKSQPQPFASNQRPSQWGTPKKHWWSALKCW